MDRMIEEVSTMDPTMSAGPAPVEGLGPLRPGAGVEVAVLSVIEVAVIILSLFIILLIWTHGSLRRNYTNWLVSNACIVILVGALFYRWAYILMAAHSGTWVLTDSCCHLMWVSDSLFHFSRPLSLFLITVTCAVFVYDPLTFSEKVTKQVVCWMIVLSWVFAGIYSGVRTYIMGWPELSESYKICHQGHNEPQVSAAVTIAIEHVVAFVALLTATLVVFLYSWRLHQSAPHGDPDLVAERRKQAKQAAILTGLANGLYIVMTLPLFITAVKIYTGYGNSGSNTSRVVYGINAAYDLVQLLLWMVLIPDISFGIKSMSECCIYEKAERTRLL